jgi:hypothetical protein
MKLEKSIPSAYPDLCVASRAHPELRPALLDHDAANRDMVRALFGDELLARGGPPFDRILDLIVFALRAMTLDAHLTSDEVRRPQTALIPCLAPYLEQLLEV